MLELYEMSYYSPFQEHIFLTLFAILELLVGTKTEQTYKVSRGIAFLLANSQEEMKSIYKELKKLYDIRSKFVHEGKKITVENVAHLRFFVQKAIIKIYDLHLNENVQKYDLIREKMLLGGFADM